MEVQILEDSDAFSDVATPCLTADPFSTNVIGVQLNGLRDGSRTPTVDAVWIAVFDGANVVGVGMHTPPHNLFLSRMPRGAASQIASALLGAGRSVPGVNGESGAVAEFAGTWTERTGSVSVKDVAMRMYRLGELVGPVGVSGASRPAGSEDQGIVREWFTRFHHEAQPHAPDEDLAGQALRRLAGGQIWLWLDADEPVSLAAASPSAAGVARVGPVYTPIASRRNGYGAAVTAAATKAALETGAAHVVLYTDLSNPTSNAIYKSLGYQPDHDAEERSLRAQPPRR